MNQVRSDLVAVGGVSKPCDQNLLHFSLYFFLIHFNSNFSMPGYIVLQPTKKKSRKRRKYKDFCRSVLIVEFCSASGSPYGISTVIKCSLNR